MNLNTDIYQISAYVDEIQKKYMDDLNEETLMMGIYGYMNETHSSIIQNAILASSELANESIPTRAKFEKSILSYANRFNIDDIYAVPAYMDIMIGFIEEELVSNMTKNKFILDRNIPIQIENIEFHLDYDIIITRNVISSNEIIYSAMYNIERDNQLSDISNPYLQPPVYINRDGDKFVFISCRMRQVENSSVFKKIISNNVLENKIVDFQFESQFANFDVRVNDPNQGYIYLTPLYEGSPTNGLTHYCYFSFLDYKTVRIKFDRASYIPKINMDIEILLQTTLGSNGNFKYNEDVIQTLQSKRFNYRSLSMLITPVSDSVYGMDGKTLDDLKQIIPKEMLARETIITTKDLENFFNTLDNNRLVFYKRQDNQLTRLYYAYLLLKDDYNNVIPTNTLDIDLGEYDFDHITSERSIMNPGKVLALKDSIYVNRTDITDIENYEIDNFAYSSPFIIVVNKQPLSVSYYLNNINEQSTFKFKYINQNSPIQFITSSLKCNKLFIDDNDKYKYSMTVQQNINTDYGLITLDDDKNIINCNVTPVIVLQNNTMKYYSKGKVVSFNKETSQYDIEFELETDNIISTDNRIKINNIKQSGQDVPVYSYFNGDIKISVYMYIKINEEYGRDDDGLVPNMDGYSLVNIYETLNETHLFYNYSDIIKSYVQVYLDEDFNPRYNIKAVPLVRYSYITTRDRCMEFIKYLQYKKVYIDESLKVLENSFGVDLKFFNTYGKSNLFKIGHGDHDYLDRVNLSLNFKVKLSEDTDTNTVEYLKREIKDYVENLNNISDIHMTNLTTVLTNKYSQYIKYIEFTGINNYNALYQYLRRLDLDKVDDVPEFININTLGNLKPDINISLV